MNGQATSGPTSFIIISGFLGSGKTTLVNRLLADGFGDERTAVVVNDFGAIDVDAALIAHREDGMLVLSNGCICCTLAADLVQGLKEMLDAGITAGAPYDRIIMETSGVTAVESLLRALAWPGFNGRLALERIVVVVDAVRHEKYRRVVRVADEQVAHADVIVLNQCDAARPEQRAAAEAAIRAVNDRAEIIPTTQCQVTRDQLGIAERRAISPAVCACGHAYHDHDGHHHGAEHGHTHEDGHHNVGHVDCDHEHVHSALECDHGHGAADDWYTGRVMFAGPVAREALEEAAQALPASVHRLKGFVCEAGGTLLHLQRVAEQVRVEAWWAEKAPEALNVLVAIGAEPIAADLEAAFGSIPGVSITSDRALHPHHHG